MERKKKKLLGMILILFAIIGLSAPLQQFASLPYQIRIFSGQESLLHLSLPVHAKASVDNPGILKVNGSAAPSFDVNLNEPLRLQSDSVGDAELNLTLFGKLPLKQMKVKVLPELKVIPGGQTIGVKLKSEGVLVVGHHSITVEDGKVSPGEDAEVKRGDWITHLNGKKLDNMKEIADLVQKSGKGSKPVELTIDRGGKTVKVKLTPALDQNSDQYRMGLYIRDSAAGVGTLTYFAPDQEMYGALGHRITDLDTQTPMTVKNGEIVYSNVTSIAKSRNGVPGEKRAHFFNQGEILGNITINSDFGIFGQMTQEPSHGPIKQPVPVALAHEVKEGPAYILTVIEGQKVEKFDIEVVQVSRQNKAATKGMVIKITDERLIDKTGGIVQGMSGSPIMQDGKLIGAVTHVFVNDPTSGYGCYIEWMLEQSGIIINPDEQRAG